MSPNLQVSYKSTNKAATYSVRTDAPYENWSNVRSDIVSKGLEGKSIVAFNFARNDVHLEVESTDVASYRQTEIDYRKYDVLSFHRCSAQQLRSLSEHMQFELSYLWFLVGPVSEDKLCEVVRTCYGINDSSVAVQGPHPEVEVIGCVANGSTVVWLNPSLRRKEDVESHLKTTVLLNTVC